MLLNLKGKIFLWSLVKLLMGTCKRWKAFYKSQLPSDGYLFKGKSKIRVASIGHFMVFTLKWLFYWKNVSSQWLLLCDSLISSYDCRKMSVFGFFMVRILPNSYWIRKDTPYLSVFSPNARKFGPEKFRIRTLHALYKLDIFILQNKLLHWLSSTESRTIFCAGYMGS